MQRSITSSLTIVAGLLAITGAASAQTVVGLDRAGTRLVQFSPSNVSVLTTSVGVTGLGAGEALTNIDFRPRTGELFAISNQNRMFVVDPATGQATLRQASGATPFSINGIAGLDFNPVPDRIRVTTSGGQNLRLNPDTGALAADDGAAVAPQPALRFVAGDANAGITPNLISVAYTNSRFNQFPTGLNTTMFGVNIRTDRVQVLPGVFQDQKSYQLVRQGSEGGAPDSPNNGNLTTIGGISGLFSDDFFGFDIFSGFGGNDAYLSGNPLVGGSAFYSLALSGPSAGSNAFLGNVGGSTPVNLRDFSVIPAPSAGALLTIAGLISARRRR